MRAEVTVSGEKKHEKIPLRTNGEVFEKK